MGLEELLFLCPTVVQGTGYEKCVRPVLQAQEVAQLAINARESCNVAAKRLEAAR